MGITQAVHGRVNLIGNAFHDFHLFFFHGLVGAIHLFQLFYHRR